MKKLVFLVVVVLGFLSIEACSHVYYMPHKTYAGTTDTVKAKK